MCAKKTTKKVTIVDDGTKFPDSLKGGHAAEFTGGKELVDAFNEEVNRITNENKAPVIGEEVSFIEEKTDDAEQPKHFAEIAETNRAELITQIHDIRIAHEKVGKWPCVFVYILGCKYDINDFKLMLRFMEKGLFLYKDTIVLTVNGEEVTKEGCYVLSNTFNKQITNTEAHIIQLFETYKTAIEFLDNRIFTGVPSKFRYLFSNPFRDAIAYWIWYDGNIIMDYIWKELFDIYADQLIGRFDGSYEYLSNAVASVRQFIEDKHINNSNQLVEAYLKKCFTTIVKDHYCPHCDMFVNSVKGYTINYPGDSDKVVDEYLKDSVENLDRYEKTYACNNCFKQHNARRPITANAKVNRNDLCSCGSGVKYKKCCGKGK